MLNTAFKIKNGLDRKEESDFVTYKSSIKNKNWETLEIMEDISTTFNKSDIQNKSEYLKKNFSKKQIITSVRITLNNKYGYLSEETIKTIEDKLDSFIDKLSKDNNPGKYS
ncbi:hypothetical protein BU012_14880, partial [Mammaliicoccus sciuri]